MYQVWRSSLVMHLKARHVQFNRKSDIFGLQIGSFRGRSFPTAGQEEQRPRVRGWSKTSNVCHAQWVQTFLLWRWSWTSPSIWEKKLIHKWNLTINRFNNMICLKNRFFLYLSLSVHISSKFFLCMLFSLVIVDVNVDIPCHTIVHRSNIYQ